MDCIAHVVIHIQMYILRKTLVQEEEFREKQFILLSLKGRHIYFIHFILNEIYKFWESVPFCPITSLVNGKW